jgi:SSS family solute:Na+ symporter
MNSMHNQSLHPLDYTVVGVYLAGIVGIGVYFSRKQTDTEEYFAGRRNIPAWAVGMSVIATLISSGTFLGLPGEGYTTNWVRLAKDFMVPVVLLGMIWFIVPCYRRVIGLSAYEYFERRFGYFARLYSSVAFSVAHFSKMGSVFFLLALALSRMTGYNTYAVIAVLGSFTIIYTLMGGIEAVVWSDVIQGFILIFGGLICVSVLLFGPEGGPAAVVGLAMENNKISFTPVDWEFSRLTVWVSLIWGFFYWLQKYGTDQTIVQRFLLAKSDKAAIKATLIGATLCVPIWMLFLFIGTCLWSYYRVTKLSLPAGIEAEAVFPYFIMTQLPPGITGLILAGITAAAMSSLDSDLNCLSAVFVEDYYRRFKRGSTDAQRLRIGRIAVAICGILAILVAFWYVTAEGDTVIDIIFTVYAVFSGGIAGLFVLGFFTKRANKSGLYVGIAACVLFTGWAILTNQGLVDFGRFNFTQHKYMIGVYSHIVLFVVGYMASFLFHREEPRKNLTLYGYLETRREDKNDDGNRAD